MGAAKNAAAAAKAAADAVVRTAYANIRPPKVEWAEQKLHEKTLRWVDRLNPDFSIPHFRPGLKEVYFPKFFVQLLRSRHLPANHARFRVSRNLGKLDLRDFLWNCYGVRAFNIRSSLKYSPIEDFDGRTMRRKLFRRQAMKFMTIEMDEPFYWPEEPKDLSPWDKKIWDYNEARIDSEQEKDITRVPWNGSDKLKWVQEDRKKVAQQARALLTGQVQWEPTWQVLEREVPDLRKPLTDYAREKN